MTDADTEDRRLIDPAELLFRQVHPSWLRDDEPTSQAFKPSAKDAGRLSVDRDSLTTAEAAFELYTGLMGLASVGTWAVTVGEVQAGEIPLRAYSDPLTEPIQDDAHAYVDFNELPRKQIETKAKLLQAAARRRGRLHP